MQYEARKSKVTSLKDSELPIMNKEVDCPMNTIIERSFSVSADTHRGKSSILHFLEHFKRQRRDV